MLPGALCLQDSLISPRTFLAGTMDRSTCKPISVFPLRQIPLYAIGFPLFNSLAFASGRLTVMPLHPASTPRKLFPATLNAAIRLAARELRGPFPYLRQGHGNCANPGKRNPMGGWHARSFIPRVKVFWGDEKQISLCARSRQQDEKSYAQFFLWA